MKWIFIFLLGVSSFTTTNAQYINYAAMHTQIDNTLKEHTRQKRIKEQTEQNLLLEQQNQEKNNTIKEKYEEIRGRLNTVAPYMQAIPVGGRIFRSIGDIQRTQAAIFSLLEEAPYAVVELYTPYLVFGADASATLGLATGIVLSYGTIAQMEQDDRMMLLSHTQTEFARLAMQSSLMYHKLRLYINQLKYGGNILNGWVNKDLQIVRDIMDNYDALGF